VKASESADFNLVAGSQGADDTVKYGANDDVGFLPGHLKGLMNLFGQIGSGHLAHTSLDHEKEYHSVPCEPRSLVRRRIGPPAAVGGDAAPSSAEPPIACAAPR
jgi:hypothetical protein